MSRKLVIRIRDPRDDAAEVIDAWRRAERGDDVADYSLTFESMGSFMGDLTLRRWELFQALRRVGASSVNALAHTLNRDYKNVHGDVRVLEVLGLVERTPDNRVEVPWDEIETHWTLAA
jgi:predicted transcriptional regulator